MSEPSPPRNLGYENLTPTSITLNWDPPNDNGGSSIVNYLIRRYDGEHASGNRLTYQSPITTRNLTDLVPGQQYTYVVQAINKSGIYSNPSGSLTVTSRTGVFMRHKGSWVRVQPYIRINAVWTPAQTFVRKTGVWQPTNN
jgi:titin